LTTSILQVLIVEFGSYAFHVYPGGLNGRDWVITVVLGALSLPVQQVINVLYRLSQKYNGSRHKKRLARQGHLSTQPVDGGHGAHSGKKTSKSKIHEE
jgi:hypothetical protein